MTATLVVNADLGGYTPAVGASQLLPNGNLAFTAGFWEHNPTASRRHIEVLPNGTNSFVQQMPGAEYRCYLLSNLYDTPPNLGMPATVYNPGFEYPILGTGVSLPV